MISTRQIIALCEIQDCGASTVRQIVSKSASLGTTGLSDSECYDFLNHCILEGLKRSRLKHLDLDDYYNALANAEKMLEESEKMGIHAVSYIDNSFPQRLLNAINENGKDDFPIVLYYKGDLSITERKSIAIIGTREPTPEGIAAGEYFGEKLAEAGFNIVSGLALGCDTAGHRGALKCSDGVTTAFLAHGLDTVYPSENRQLAEEIIDRGGLLMSEYPIGKTVNRFFLVARDRLQAALSDATIVIQTSVGGGSNHAAKATLLSGKPLFCVKYNTEALIRHAKVMGNQALVDKGAHYITSQDYLAVINNGNYIRVNYK